MANKKIEVDEQLLRRVKFEIEQLRSDNERMTIRLNMFDEVMSVLHSDIAHKEMVNGHDIVADIVGAIEGFET